MFRAGCIVLFTSLCLAASTHGQQQIVNLQRYNLAEGLSQGSVQCMTQDHLGFMWFGTQDGLNQFDGYEFTIYRHDTHDTTTISDNNITAIIEDDDRHLWIGTFSGGLNFFDRRKGSFKSFTVTERPGSISSNRITAITIDEKDNLWVGTDNGLNMLTSDSLFRQFFTNPSDNNSLSSDEITVLYHDKQNALWIGTANGLNRFDPASKLITRFLIPFSDKSSNHITTVHHLDENRYAVGTHGAGLFIFDVGSEKFEPVSFNGIQQNKVSDVLSDPEGNIWIAFEGEGVVRWNKKRNSQINLRMDPSNPNSLSNDMVHSLHADTFGNLWIGTLNGADKYILANRKFNLYQNKPGIRGHIHNSVFAILKDSDGNIWTGSRDGLFQLDSEGKLSLFKDNPTQPGSLRDDGARSIYQDKSGSIWIGTELGTLEKFDRKRNSFQSCWINKTLPENAVYVIREDRRGKFWLGTAQGLYRFDPKSGVSMHFNWQQSIKTSTNTKEIRSIELDDKDNLWIGTRGAGLFYFDQQKLEFSHYESRPDDSTALSHNVIASIYIDRDRKLIWLGTASGFNRFDVSNNIFHTYSERDGLPNDVVYGILPDNDGNLWLSTNGGLVKFDPVHESFRTYDTSDGLQSNEFNACAYFKAPDGELFFGGINGYNSFFPAEVKDNALLPQIVLTGFKVFNEPINLATSIHHVDEIKLSYEDYVFSFEFSGIHLTAPDKNNYVYKLEGFDPDWVETKRRFATYTNLDPGTYTFRVRASNNDGVWNETGLAIPIVITPPFWRTWWFIVLMVVILATLIYAVYRYRITQIRKEEQLKTEFNKKLAEVEMSALRAQMNPHFLFNSLNSINRYIVKSDPETASSYLTKFSRLIRLILQNSKASTVSLKNELEALRLYIEMESIRFDNKFDYAIRLGENIEADYIEVPPMLLQPYVENAIWHGLMHKSSKGKLEITIDEERNHLICTIQDNGIGRKRAEELKSKSATLNKSMGMKITRDRLNLYATPTKVEIIDLYDEVGESLGTRVVLGVPYSIEQERFQLQT